MPEIQFLDSLPEKYRLPTLKIFYKAFKLKIENLEIRPKNETQCINILLESGSSDLLLVFLKDNDVVGTLGLQTYEKKFYHISWATYKHEFGFFGALLRYIIQIIVKERINKTDLYIAGIAVSENRRGSGIGTKLIHFVLNYAKEKGYKNVLLDVVDTNEKAHKLYKKLGFKDIKFRKFGFLTRKAGFEGAYRMKYTLLE